MPRKLKNKDNKSLTPSLWLPRPRRIRSRKPWRVVTSMKRTGFGARPAKIRSPTSLDPATEAGRTPQKGARRYRGAPPAQLLVGAEVLKGPAMKLWKCGAPQATYVRISTLGFADGSEKQTGGRARLATPHGTIVSKHLSGVTEPRSMDSKSKPHVKTSMPPG